MRATDLVRKRLPKREDGEEEEEEEAHEQRKSRESPLSLVDLTSHLEPSSRDEQQDTCSLHDAIPVNLTHATSLTPRGVVSHHSPFDYLEVNSFGGDTTLRVGGTPSPLIGFPPPPSHDALPLDTPPLVNLLLGEKVHFRTNASTSDDAGFDGDEDWIPSRVTFSEDVRVFEYEKAQYESDPLEGFCAGSQCTGVDYMDEEDENAVHAPADVAFIPLIPNRRLVTGGNSITELRRYLAARSAGRDPPTFIHDDAGGDTTRRNAPTACLPSLLCPADPTPKDSSGRASGFHSCMSSMDGPTLTFADAIESSELTTPSKGAASTTTVASFAPALTV